MKNPLEILGKFVSKYGIEYGYTFCSLAALWLYLIFQYASFTPAQVVSMIIALSPLWLPIITFELFFNQWMTMVKRSYRISQGRVTLRIKPPPEVFKSPEAMEFVFTQIWNKHSPDNLMHTYLQGKHPVGYGIEIVSIGGDVRLYVNVPSKRTKDAFEAAMYSQYPGIEIVEESVDYVGEITRDLDKYDMFSFHWTKKEDSHFPIKTYIDFGLDKLPKEEEKVDPMTPMLEFLGTKVKSHERVWIQIIAIPAREDSFKHGQLFGSSPEWTKVAKEYIDTFLNRDSKKKTSLDKINNEEQVRLTSGERDTIAAIERNIEKYAYWTAIRYIYITKKGHFNGDLIGPINRTLGQYDMNIRNGLGIRWRTDFDYMFFEDPFGKRLPSLKLQELYEYKLRKLFEKNPVMEYKIMTVEELATMFHVPGKVALTPTMGRIESTRSTAPPNLPVAKP